MSTIFYNLGTRKAFVSQNLDTREKIHISGSIKKTRSFAWHKHMYEHTHKHTHTPPKQTKKIIKSKKRKQTRR